MKLIWPGIFTDENFEYAENTEQPATAIADGLMGWGNCHAGGEIPKNFGKGMVKINKIAGTATPDGLMAAGSKWLKESRK